jgi:hypothetical protein
MAETAIKVGLSEPFSRLLKEIGRDVSAVLNVRGAERLFGGNPRQGVGLVPCKDSCGSSGRWCWADRAA